MQVVVRSNGQEREVDLELRSPQATVGDLSAALGSAGPVAVIGRRLPPDCLVADAGLVQGGLVDLDGGFVPTPFEHAASRWSSSPVSTRAAAGR